MANDNPNKIHRNSNPGPSMRQLANERMREMKKASAAAKEASGERRERPSDSIRKDGEVRRERPASERPSERRERPAERTGERRERPAERTAERRERPAERSSRPAEAKRPASRPANGHSNRPAAREAINEERRLNSKNHAGNASRNNSGSRQASKAKSNERKLPKFWIAFAVYTVILLILSGLFLVYTDVCLKKYEASQPEKYMAKYLEDFTSKAQNHSFESSDFTFENLNLTFVDTDSIANEYIESLDASASYTFEKEATSYNTEAPVYDIFANGEPVAKVTLKAISQTKIFAILTIMDWDVASVEPITSITLTNYTFLIPENYTPVIGDTMVDISYQTGEKQMLPEFEFVSKYVTMPYMVEYKVNNVLENSPIKVLNPAGEEIECSINGNVVKALYTSPSATLSDERKEEALSMVQTYEDFMTSDLSGANHGLATVQAVLVKDSDYWTKAKQWATGTDITFTSAHTFGDPKYSDLVVDEYNEYSDVCYSLHIAFSKNMILSRTGEKTTNDFDSTVFFVYYDDTDDGVDNAHWCIADMISTTK